MISAFQAMCDELTAAIKRSYEEGVTVEEAERLAGQFLHAQLVVSGELRKADLDYSMRKSGTKAVRAAVYLESATKGDKKPSDVMLNAIVDVNDLVQGEQSRMDEAEAHRDFLQNHLNVFRDAHIHFRGIAKGKFE